MKTEEGTRERCLRAALEMLLEGAADPSMGTIASLAGISRQALYLHFPSRADLLVATADWANEQIGLRERVAAVARARTGPAKLKQFAAVVVWQVNRIGPAMRALSRLVEKDPELAERWRARGGRAEQVTAIVESLAAEGRLRHGLSRPVAATIVLSLTVPETATALLRSGMPETKAAQALYLALEGAIC